MEERYQKELFDEFKPKRHFAKNDNIVPKTKFSLTLSLEKTVFSSIAIVMAMVAIYAVGVERGKVIQREARTLNTSKTIKSVTVGLQNTPQPQAPAVPVQKVPQAAQQAAQPPAAQPVPAQAQQVQAAALSLSQQPKPYTIVGATFTRKEWADKEIEKLKKNGFDGTVYQSSNYFLVCIGSYQTKDEAKQALPKIRSTYKDAYLRSR
jgi:cell division septation protein DedD